MACIKELFVEDKYSGRDLREWKLYRNFGKWYQKYNSVHEHSTVNKASPCLLLRPKQNNQQISVTHRLQVNMCCQIMPLEMAANHNYYSESKISTKWWCCEANLLLLISMFGDICESNWFSQPFIFLHTHSRISKGGWRLIWFCSQLP